jgi:hypothetical protein
MYPVVQPFAVAVAVSRARSPNRHCYLPNNFDSVELHAHRKYSLVLAIFKLWVCPNDGAVVVVIHSLVVGVDELAPFLLPFLALHFIFVYGGLWVEFGEFLLEMLVDFVVEFGKS